MCRIDKSTLKFIQEFKGEKQRSRKGEAREREDLRRNKVEGLSLPDFKLAPKLQ